MKIGRRCDQPIYNTFSRKSHIYIPFIWRLKYFQFSLSILLGVQQAPTAVNLLSARQKQHYANVPEEVMPVKVAWKPVWVPLLSEEKSNHTDDPLDE